MAIETDTDYNTPQGVLRLVIVYDQLIKLTVINYTAFIPIKLVQEIGMVKAITHYLERANYKNIPSLVKTNAYVLEAVKHVMEK